MTASTPRPRGAIAELPAYISGRPPTPRPGLATHKLSSNENPFAPPRELLYAASEAAASMNRYPDMGCTSLYAALAGYLGVSVDRLAAGTGSPPLGSPLLRDGSPRATYSPSSSTAPTVSRSLRWWSPTRITPSSPAPAPGKGSAPPPRR